jgi:hypothetical protein
MGKGYQANQDRKAEIASFGKQLAKRAGFICEWCGSKDDLRPWDAAPTQEPEEANLALLCGHCRFLAEGGKGEEQELHDLRNALWSDVPAIAGGAAAVLARHRVAWAREAIEESLLPEDLKERLVKGL